LRCLPDFAAVFFTESSLAHLPSPPYAVVPHLAPNGYGEAQSCR
jgi:hypothetical protein